MYDHEIYNDEKCNDQIKMLSADEDGNYSTVRFNLDFFEYLLDKHADLTVKFLEKVDCGKLPPEFFYLIFNSKNQALLDEMYRNLNYEKWVHSWIKKAGSSIHAILGMVEQGNIEAYELAMKYYIELPSLISIPPDLQSEADQLYIKLKRDDGYYEKFIEKPELIKERMQASNTLQSSKYSTNHAISSSSKVSNFYDCVLMISQMARGARKQHDLITQEFINDINYHLRQKLTNSDDRQGDSKLKLDSLRFEVLKASGQGYYLPQRLVRSAFNDFIKWLNDELKQCDDGAKNPIIVAAIAYQRLISIHPYPDGNGRTGRMLMDYVLQRYGLPPACVNDMVATFIGNPLESSNAPRAVNATIEGLNTTIKLITPKPGLISRFFKQFNTQSPSSQSNDNDDGPGIPQ